MQGQLASAFRLRGKTAIVHEPKATCKRAGLLFDRKACRCSSLDNVGHLQILLNSINDNSSRKHRLHFVATCLRRPPHPTQDQGTCHNLAENAALLGNYMPNSKHRQRAFSGPRSAAWRAASAAAFQRARRVGRRSGAACRGTGPSRCLDMRAKQCVTELSPQGVEHEEKGSCSGCA